MWYSFIFFNIKLIFLQGNLLQMTNPGQCLLYIFDYHENVGRKCELSVMIGLKSLLMGSLRRHYSMPLVNSVFLKLEYVSESLSGLVKAQIVGPHS